MLTKSIMLKIGWFLSISLFLIGTVVVANHIFFREIEIKKQIAWVNEFKIEIPKIILNEPCVLVIESKTIGGPEMVLEDNKLIIQKQKVEMGACTNRRILVPLRIENIAKNNNRLFFFVPQFRARITGGEEQLEADFSLYLKVNGVCPKGKETRIKGNGFVLCDLNISSTNVKSFSITETRKNTLAEAVKSLVNRDDYILVLEIAPDLEMIKDSAPSSFSIIIENITPEVIIVR